MLEPIEAHHVTPGSVCLPADEDDPFGGYNDRKMRQANMPHPEAKLCKVIGAVSNVCPQKGSMITYKMCKIFNDFLDAGKNMYIHEVFDSMQTTFNGRKNDWRPECIWTHDTRYLMFKKCRKNKKKSKQLQIMYDDVMFFEEEEGKEKQDNILDDDDESIAKP